MKSNEALPLQGIGDRDVGIYVKKVVPGSVADKVGAGRICVHVGYVGGIYSP